MTSWDRHNIHNLNPIMRKHQTNPNWGIFCKIMASTLPVSRSERLTKCPRLEEIKESWQLNAIWVPGLEKGHLWDNWPNMPFWPHSKLDLEGTTFQLIELPEKTCRTFPNTCLGDLQRCMESTKHIVVAPERFVWYLLGGWDHWRSNQSADLQEQSCTWERGDFSSPGPSHLVYQIPGCWESCCQESHSPVCNTGGVAWGLMGSTPWMNLWILFGQ